MVYEWLRNDSEKTFNSHPDRLDSIVGASTPRIFIVICLGKIIIQQHTKWPIKWIVKLSLWWCWCLDVHNHVTKTERKMFTCDVKALPFWGGSWDRLRTFYDSCRRKFHPVTELHFRPHHERFVNNIFIHIIADPRDSQCRSFFPSFRWFANQVGWLNGRRKKKNNNESKRDNDLYALFNAVMFVLPGKLSFGCELRWSVARYKQTWLLSLFVFPGSRFRVDARHHLHFFSTLRNRFKHCKSRRFSVRRVTFPTFWFIFKHFFFLTNFTAFVVDVHVDFLKEGEKKSDFW